MPESCGLILCLRFSCIPVLLYKNMNTLIVYILSVLLAEESMEKTSDVMKVSLCILITPSFCVCVQ